MGLATTSNPELDAPGCYTSIDTVDDYYWDISDDLYLNGCGITTGASFGTMFVGGLYLRYARHQ